MRRINDVASILNQAAEQMRLSRLHHSQDCYRFYGPGRWPYEYPRSVRHFGACGAMRRAYMELNAFTTERLGLRVPVYALTLAQFRYRERAINNGGNVHNMYYYERFDDPRRVQALKQAALASV